MVVVCCVAFPLLFQTSSHQTSGLDVSGSSPSVDSCYGNRRWRLKTFAMVASDSLLWLRLWRVLFPSVSLPLLILHQERGHAYAHACRRWLWNCVLARHKSVEHRSRNWKIWLILNADNELSFPFSLKEWFPSTWKADLMVELVDMIKLFFARAEFKAVWLWRE